MWFGDIGLENDSNGFGLETGVLKLVVVGSVWRLGS